MSLEMAVLELYVNVGIKHNLTAVVIMSHRLYCIIEKIQ